MPKHDNKISFLNLSHTFEYIHLDSPHTKPSNDAILKKHYICQFSSCDNRCDHKHDADCGGLRVYRYAYRFYGYRQYRLYGRCDDKCEKCVHDEGKDHFYDYCDDNDYKCTKCGHVYCYNCCF
jgi:hypothetical protein